MNVTVIIVSFNTRDILQQCLQALFSHQGAHALEVFVVDNASGDGSAQMVREGFAGRVELIENDTNRGFAAANNQAFERCRGNYVILLNPDAFVQSGSIDSAVAFMETHPECGLCGGRLVKPDGALDPSARRFPNSLYKLFTLSGLSDRFATSRIFGRGDFKYFAHDRAIEVDWVPGTFTVYRRRMLTQTGLFDERFFVYYEETDLCLRVKRWGWKVFFIPDAQVVHMGGASAKTRKDKAFDASGSQVLSYRLRSEWLYYRKNYGLLSVIANAGVEIGWHLLRFLVNLRREDGKDRRGRRRSSALIMKAALAALWDTSLGKSAPPVPW